MRRFVVGSVVVAAVVGIFYLATLGCCQLIGFSKPPASLADDLSLSASQRQAIASLETGFLQRKGASCEALCAKRALAIQLLQRDADRAALFSLVEEIGQEQTALEKATLDHLLSLNQHLDAAQREKLASRMTDQLRTACTSTACGTTPGCRVTGTGETD